MRREGLERRLARVARESPSQALLTVVVADFALGAFGLRF
jgi:hypothetical protein